MQADRADAIVHLGMTQVSTGPAGGSNATVLQDGVEVGGCTSPSLSGRERLHGGEDQGQTVCHILVWGTGQSWCVACGGSAVKISISDCLAGKRGCCCTVLQKYTVIIPTCLPHLQPWLLLLCSVTPALQSPSLSLLQCEEAYMRKRQICWHTGDKCSEGMQPWEFTSRITGANGRQVNIVNLENSHKLWTRLKNVNVRVC